MSHGDRRRAERFEVAGELWGSVGTVEVLNVRDVSVSGLLVESRRPLPVDGRHRVRLVLGTVASEVFARVSRVSWAGGTDRRERYLIGLEFLELPPALAQHIAQLVAGEVRD